MFRSARQTKWKVVLVDDAPVIFEALDRLLTPKHGIQLLEIVPPDAKGIGRLDRIKPHIVILDPGKSGIEMILSIKRLKNPPRILVFSGEQENVCDSFLAGADGFLLKARPTSEILCAVAALAAGGTYFDNTSAGILRNGLHQASGSMQMVLQGEELCVAQFLYLGCTSKEIATKLDCATRKVERIRAKLILRFSVRNSAALISKLGAVLFHEGKTAAEPLRSGRQLI